MNTTVSTQLLDQIESLKLSEVTQLYIDMANQTVKKTQSLAKKVNELMVSATTSPSRPQNSLK